MNAVLKQHPRLDKALVHWGHNHNATKCYLPQTHGQHGWCNTNGGDWGFCYSSCNEKASSPVQKTKELRVRHHSKLYRVLEDLISVWV